MVSRLQPIRIQLTYMLSTIYQYTANRFKCRLPTRLQQKTIWPPTVASTTNWNSRVDQTSRTRLVLVAVIQAYRITPLLTYRSEVITSLTTSARNRPVVRHIFPTHLTPSPCILTSTLSLLSSHAIYIEFVCYLYEVRMLSLSSSYAISIEFVCYLYCSYAIFIEFVCYLYWVHMLSLLS